jgi:DNA-directed RNA polymerase subunit E'/Rpb7
MCFCAGKYGFVIAVTTIDSVGAGLIKPGEGFVVYPVKYKAIVFRPFKGEVLDAVVTQVQAGFRIHDILVWIRIRGLMPLTNRSGSIFVIDRQDANKKLISKKMFFCLILFEDTFKSFFKDKKSQRSRKTVRIKVFLTIFASL